LFEDASGARHFASENGRDGEVFSRAFNAAKLVYHRIHMPGDGLHYVYTAQLLAVLHGLMDSVDVCIDGEEIETVEGLIDMLTDDQVTATDKCENSEKWQITGRGIQFLQSLNMLCYELSRARQDEALLVGINVDREPDGLVIRCDCEGSFEPARLHLKEAGNGIDYSEHGMTSAYVALSESLRPSRTCSCGLSLEHLRDDDHVVFKLNLPHAGGDNR
jgi:hypothetical protein